MSHPHDAEATLARWREEEAAMRAKRGEIGVARPEQVAGMSGIEVFQAMFEGRLPAPPIGETLDFLAVHVEHGLAVVAPHVVREEGQHGRPAGVQDHVVGAGLEAAQIEVITRPSGSKKEPTPPPN